MNYEVIVGNIGTVFSSHNQRDALRCFREYVELSKSGSGRAQGEEVTMMLGGEIAKSYIPKQAKPPTIKELAELARDVKRSIQDDYRVTDDPDDLLPGINLTVGWSDKTGGWSYQTGDNSFTGGAYGYPHWAVVGVYRRSNSREVAQEIQEQLLDLANQ